MDGLYSLHSPIDNSEPGRIAKAIEAGAVSAAEDGNMWVNGLIISICSAGIGECILRVYEEVMCGPYVEEPARSPHKIPVTSNLRMICILGEKGYPMCLTITPYRELCFTPMVPFVGHYVRSVRDGALWSDLWVISLVEPTKDGNLLIYEIRYLLLEHMRLR